MRKNKILGTILLVISFSIFSQEYDTTDFLFPNKEGKDLGIILGIHQYRNTFFELGISQSKSRSGCVFGSYFYGKSLSIEYNPFQQKCGIIVSFWSSIISILTWGINVNSYTDFYKYNLGFKPFIGIGPGKLSLTYGYNFQFIDRNLSNLNKHCFSLRYHLTIKELK